MDEGFQRRSATNKVNRASAKGVRYTAVAKELNRESTLAEVFKQTHTRKKNKEEWSAHEGNGLNNPTVVDPDEVWRDVGMSEPPLSQHTVEEAEERVQQFLTQAELRMNAIVQEAREELLREREEFQKMREEMAAYYASVRAGPSSGVGLTTMAAPAAQPDGDRGQEKEDDADDYQDF
ncbi:hypothetical protein PIB30_058679 [Stylosanthes scabra]|uniref:Uncharacterized protein n=1 Tax=Stylosanthes scabra TaxID=79078 RepID=A0ABU6TM75_9FABA|nr:hypothetical protein [Stylosanthes scabra]